MIITLITVIGIASLIVAHEWGHFWAAKKCNLRIEEFGVGFPPRIFARKKGETVYSLNWLPLGGFVRIAGEGESEEELASVSIEERKRLFVFQKPWKKALIVVAGVCMNLLLGWLILTAVFLIGTPQGIMINQVEHGSPAESAGLVSGNVILGYGEKNESVEVGKNMTAPEFIAFIDTHQGQEMSLLVQTKGEKKMITATPREKKEANQGALGIRLTEIGIPQQNIADALILSFQQAQMIIILTLEGLGHLVTDLFTQGTVPEGVVGPVGIFQFAYDTGSMNLIYLLHLLSIISLNLAVLNLIPLPALDGGHLLFIILEKIKGSPIQKNTKLMANTAGISLLIILMLILTFRDVSHIFSL